MLWEYGSYASDGVRQVAEFGSPIKMEEEIRQKVGLTLNVACLSVKYLEISVRLIRYNYNLNLCPINIYEYCLFSLRMVL